MMNIESVREYCLTKKGTNESFPFDDDTLVFKVGGKIFACILLINPDRLILKCDTEFAVELREKYLFIEPAWHFNKKYWNQINLLSATDSLICDLIDHSYDEVVKKLPKKIKTLL